MRYNSYIATVEKKWQKHCQFERGETTRELFSREDHLNSLRERPDFFKQIKPAQFSSGEKMKGDNKISETTEIHQVYNLSN